MKCRGRYDHKWELKYLAFHNVDKKELHDFYDRDIPKNL